VKYAVGMERGFEDVAEVSCDDAGRRPDRW